MSKPKYASAQGPRWFRYKEKLFSQITVYPTKGKAKQQGKKMKKEAGVTQFHTIRCKRGGYWLYVTWE